MEDEVFMGKVIVQIAIFETQLKNMGEKILSMDFLKIILTMSF